MIDQLKEVKVLPNWSPQSLYLLVSPWAFQIFYLFEESLRGLDEFTKKPNPNTDFKKQGQKGRAMFI